MVTDLMLRGAAHGVLTTLRPIRSNSRRVSPLSAAFAGPALNSEATTETATDWRTVAVNVRVERPGTAMARAAENEEQGGEDLCRGGSDRTKGYAVSLQPQFHAIFGLASSWPTRFQNLNQGVENRRPGMTPRCGQFGLDQRDICWMARIKPLLKYHGSLVMPQPLARKVGVLPHKGEALVGCAKAAAQNVVERVEIAAPFIPAQHSLAQRAAKPSAAAMG